MNTYDEHILAAVRALVEKQEADDRLWEYAGDIETAYIQRALKLLHNAVNGLTDESIELLD